MSPNASYTSGRASAFFPLWWPTVFTFTLLVSKSMNLHCFEPSRLKLRVLSVEAVYWVFITTGCFHQVEGWSLYSLHLHCISLWSLCGQWPVRATLNCPIINVVFLWFLLGSTTFSPYWPKTPLHYSFFHPILLYSAAVVMYRIILLKTFASQPFWHLERGQAFNLQYMKT